MTLDGTLEITRAQPQQAIHVRYRPFSVPADRCRGGLRTTQVLSYDAAVAVAQANGEQLLDPRDLLQLYGSAHTKPIGAYQLLAQERPAFFVRGAYWWEGDALYLSLGDESQSLFFNPKSNLHAWHDGAPTATRYDLPNRVLRQRVDWRTAVFDEYGRPVDSGAAHSVVIASQVRYPLRRFFAMNRGLSADLFGQTYSRLPWEIQEASIELPSRSGVPVPLTYDINRRLLCGMLWTNTLVTKRLA